MIKIIWTLFVLCTISTNSAAALIQYEFSGSINRMFEHDGATKENTNVLNSSLFGSNIAVGDTFTGSFTYDSNAVESSYRTNNPDQNAAVFQHAVLDFSFSVGDFEYRDMTPAGILDSLVLFNDRDTGHKDAFSVQSSNSLDTYYSSASMGFFDSDGDAFDDFFIPTNLDLNDFLGYGYFHSALLDHDTKDQLHFYGQATSITKVNEPSTLFLFLVSCIVFGMRKNKTLSCKD